MKRDITELPKFSREIDGLIESRKVLHEDFKEFKKALTQNPKMGDVIRGTGGVRKTRLKSATKGKRGGFRVCYFDDEEREELFLMAIYPKNEKEDLSSDEKKALKKWTERLKV